MNKKIYLYISFLFVLFSCSKSTEEVVTNTEEHNEEINLTADQIKVNKIEFGYVQTRTIDSKISVTGMLHALPENKRVIHSPIDGFLEKINFISGEYVQKGRVLATVKNLSFIALQKQFLESYFTMNLNLKDYQRKKTLLEADAISRKDYEQAQAIYQVSLSGYEALRSELITLGFNPGAIISSKKINPILPIISPVSGFIEAEELSPGKQITSSDELFMIINQDRLHIELNVPTRYVVDLYPGQEVLFRLNEIKDTLKGSIHLIGRVTNPENNTVQIHADIESKLPPDKFYEGRFVNALIINKTDPKNILPKNSVFEEGEKHYVFIRKKGNIVERKEIKTGIENNEFIEVLNLSPQQEVVISGVYYLKAGELGGHDH